LTRLSMPFMKIWHREGVTSNSKYILVTIKLPLSVAYQYNGTCGERKSNHGEGCKRKIFNCRIVGVR